MNKKTYIAGKFAMAMLLACGLNSCTRDIDSDTLADFPSISDVFIDGFASDMDFQAWGKSTNFTIDKDTKYEGTASIKIEVPGPDDPLGTWAGGNLFSKMGRNLTGYDALTFYAKSSVPTTLEAGFGNYGDNSDYQVTVKDFKLNTNWQQYIIPIPNAAKLTDQQGLFFYSAGMVNNEGYSIWVDDVKYVRLQTLAHTSFVDEEQPGFPGKLTLDNLTVKVSLPNGSTQSMEASPKYFTFVSSNPNVATVEGDTVFIHKTGEATLMANEASGRINLHCYDYATTPAKDPSDVISLLSSAYTSKITANWNPYWQYSTAEYKDINTGKAHLAQYTNLNFVGIVFNSVADCSEMTHLHLDFLSMDDVPSNAEFKLEVHNGSTSTVDTFTPANTPEFKKGRWVSVDVPLTALGNNKNVNQLVLAVNGIKNILMDNIYFYR